MTNRNRQTGSQRALVWTNMQASGATTAVNSTIVIDLGTIIESDLSRDLAGDTLTAIKGWFSLLETTGALGSGATIRTAILRARKGAVNTDFSLTTENPDALWYNTIHWKRMDAETAAGVFDIVPLYIQLDVKAQRKITLGETLYFVIESNVGNINFFLSARALWRLR